MAIELEQLDFESKGSSGAVAVISQFLVNDSVRGLCHGVFDSSLVQHPFCNFPEH